jgi:hypothetical protein
VLDENGNPLRTTEKFPLGLFSNGATTTKTIFSFAMGGNAEKQIDGYGLVLKGDDQSRKIQIHVVNKNGKATATTGDYKVMSINPAEATIKRGDTKPPTIVITLQKQKKETESTKPTESSSNTEKDDFGDGKATLLHATVRELGFYIPMMHLLDRLFGQNGLAAALPVGELLGAIFALWLLHRALHKTRAEVEA